MSVPDFGHHLLIPEDGQPVAVAGDLLSPGPFLIIGDHAGNAVPSALHSLGLGSRDLGRHIGIDIGTEALGLALAERLTAPFLRQRFSRLVIDCNRSPDAMDAIPAVSDGTVIEGNASLGARARQARVAEIFDPYHQAITAALDARAAAGLRTVLVSLHSFTPRLAGMERPWHLGVLHAGANDEFALAVLRRLTAHSRLLIGDNEPYRMDTTDYTVPRHAFARDLPYLELEVRQDLLSSDIDNRLDDVAKLVAETLAACL